MLASLSSCSISVYVVMYSFLPTAVGYDSTDISLPALVVSVPIVDLDSTFLSSNPAALHIDVSCDITRCTVASTLDGSLFVKNPV